MVLMKIYLIWMMIFHKLWDEQGRDKEEKEKAEDKTYEKENS